VRGQLPLTSRTLNLTLPISFDEVHFGKFAAYYILRQYYFDVHPPFAKLLFGLAGWFVGFDGHFMFENIGDSYTDNHVPYVGMRALPAILGSLTIPVVFLIMKESGYSTIVACFSAILVLLGTFPAFSSQICAHMRGRQRPCRAVASHPPRCHPDLLHVAYHLRLHPLPQAPLPRVYSRLVGLADRHGCLHGLYLGVQSQRYLDRVLHWHCRPRRPLGSPGQQEGTHDGTLSFSCLVLAY
jgi:hypothetical protein